MDLVEGIVILFFNVDLICGREEERQLCRGLLHSLVDTLSTVLHRADGVKLNEIGGNDTLGTHYVVTGTNLLRALGWLLAYHQLLTGRAAVVSEPSLCSRPQTTTLFLSIAANLWL
jgi:hypothetical protein